MKKMFLAYTTLIITFFSAYVFAAIVDLGEHGATFEILEKDLLKVLQQKMSSGEGQQLLAQLDENLMKEKINGPQPKAVPHITLAKDDREFYVDPSLELSTDLSDHKGQVFYKAGEKVNPLSMITLSKGYIFIDGDKKSHIEFAKNVCNQKHMFIILVKGNIQQIQKENPSLHIFFDQDGVMCHRFQITKVPSVMEQDGLKLKVTEHRLGALS